MSRLSQMLGWACCSAFLLGWLIQPLSGSPVWQDTPAKPAVAIAAAPDFQSQILPLLSDRCFTCHGPDAAANESGLRLDLRAEAIAEAPSGDGATLVPGQATKSLLWQRITTADADLVMPPPGGNRQPLSKSEIDLLKRWIDAGAEYQQHWSLEPIPDSVVVPNQPNDRWSRSEIDRFVLAMAEPQGLTPAAEAERWRWLRRVTLDLSGQVPTVSEVQAFLDDRQGDAYERVVDRLLASPTFGQTMAVDWLDVARYADSYGYQSDQLCQVWPYRDWVIKALNDNLPYDQFVVQQIAGDLLPSGTREQKLATTFNRLHRQTNEGGSIDEEWRIEYAADRVHTMGTAFLGLTLECARCHDHKFDPISTREYYQLMAYFNSIDESGTYNDAVHIPTPTLMLPTPEQEQRWQALLAAEPGLTEQSNRIQSDAQPTFDAWLSQRRSPKPLTPKLHFDFDERVEQSYRNVIGGTVMAQTRAANPAVAGVQGQALQFSGDDPLVVPAFPLSPSQPFTIAMWLRGPEKLDQAMVFHQSSGTDTGFSGAELTMRSGQLRLALVRFWPGNAVAIESNILLPRNEWIHVVASYDGSGSASGMSLAINGVSDSEVLRDRLTKSPASQQNITFGERFRTPGCQGVELDELVIFDESLTELERLWLYQPQERERLWQEATRDQLWEYYLAREVPALRLAWLERQKWVRQKFALQDSIQEVMVMEELAQERETYILPRGEYDSPKTPEARVQRDIPKVLQPKGLSRPQNRLELAQWLINPHHPLTARVAVNRIWQHFWGAGLVETTNDFGLQGVRPSHPALLDWLARDFIENGWDVKRLCRQIVLSATYRQSSQVDLAGRQADPQNRWLMRGPSQRLSAESIRDLALQVSGLLDARLDGPPVSPYQPDGLWTESNSMSPGYQPSQGTDRFRRSLYSVWKRTAPLPNMLALDAANRETCTARRSLTNTPVQALVLLNDPQFIEAARIWAAKLLAETSANTPATTVDGQPATTTVEQRLTQMFVAVSSRPPRADELQILQRLLQEQLEQYRRDDAEAKKLLAIGTEPASAVPGVEPAELAAWTTVALTLFNTDHAIWKR